MNHLPVDTSNVSPSDVLETVHGQDLFLIKSLRVHYSVQSETPNTFIYSSISCI